MNIIPRITPRIPQRGFSRPHYRQVSSAARLKTNTKICVKAYCILFGGLGAALGANEGFWKGMRLREGLIFLPITICDGMVTGALLGIASVPLVIAAFAFDRFENAYRVRERSW